MVLVVAELTYSSIPSLDGFIEDASGSIILGGA
jgi:hypothetical protein